MVIVIDFRCSVLICGQIVSDCQLSFNQDGIAPRNIAPTLRKCGFL
jgi:hypothetical protein